MLNPATPPILPTPPFLWEKSEPPLFENFENSIPTPFIKRGVPNML